MVATGKEIDALETFFKTINIPRQLKTNKATTYLDLPLFVQDNLEKLKSNSIPDVVVSPRYIDLLRIKEILISGESFE